MITLNMILNTHMIIFLASTHISFCKFEKVLTQEMPKEVKKEPGVITYEQYSLYTTTPTESHHLKFLKNLESQKYIDVIFWKRPVKLYYDVQFLLSQTEKEIFLERARHYRLNVTMTIEDVQDAFTHQTVMRYVRLKDGSFNWLNYHSLEDIYQWLSDLALQFPNSSYLQSIGRTAEDRDIYVFVIKNPGATKKAMIEGGIHSDEWISVEFVTYLINSLLHPTTSTVRKLATHYIWFLIPILNPDGFYYSHTRDRLWRKNRRRYGTEFGVDLDRNFNYNFRAYSSSDDPKDDEYCGPSAFSEAETNAIRNFLRQNYRDLRFYFSFHAYGQKIILPYGDRVKHVEDYTEMENYGKQAIVEMYRATGVKYKIGTSYDTMGVKISGNSASWVKKTYRVKYVMSFLLRDKGAYGHALPADEILPTCKETLIGLQKIMTAEPKYVRHSLFGNSATRNVLSLYMYTYWLFYI